MFSNASGQRKLNDYYAAGMPEREQWMQWIAACRLDGLNVTSVTVSLDRQKDKLRNSLTNPTYLFKNT